jgi:hypothetical protein
MNEHTLTEWLAVCAKEPDLKEPMTISDHVGLLDRGGIVTVIGARESNVPEYWDNPRCVFMDGYDAVSRGLPQNARAVSRRSQSKGPGNSSEPSRPYYTQT